MLVLLKASRACCDVDTLFCFRLYDTYSFQVIPVMGEIIAGDWKAYQYLAESIRKFPNQETFSQMIDDGGFKAVSFTNLMFGVCAIHSGFKF